MLVQVFYHGQEEDDEALMVEPDDVLQLLKNFIQELVSCTPQAHATDASHFLGLFLWPGTSQEKENARIADVAPDKKKKADGI